MKKLTVAIAPLPALASSDLEEIEEISREISLDRELSPLAEKSHSIATAGESAFLGYIHCFRALAIFFIVAGHSIDAFSWTNNQNLERLLRIFVSNGSTLFIFIAGYLFQHLSTKYETRKYWASKLKNIIAPYFLASIPAVIIFVFFIERDSVWDGFYEYPAWAQIGLFYLTGAHLSPFWFIPMISIFYLIAPLLIKADQKHTIYYLLPIFVLMSCCIDRGLPYQNFIHYFSAYLLGMACSKYKLVLNPVISNRNVLHAVLLSVVILGTLEFLTMESTMTYLNYLQKLTMSIFFLGLFFKYNSKLNSEFISTIANTSFGIYFIHSYFLTANKMIYKEYFGELPNGSLLMCLLTAISVLISCVLIVLIIKKISGKHSRHLIGS